MFGQGCQRITIIILPGASTLNLIDHCLRKQYLIFTDKPNSGGVEDINRIMLTSILPAGKLQENHIFLEFYDINPFKK